MSAPLPSFRLRGARWLLTAPVPAQVAWSLYKCCYEDAKDKAASDSKVPYIVDIPWLIPECRLLLRENKAVCLAAEREPDKFMLTTSLVPRAGTQAR
jgi:hypothetical protein